MIVFAADSCRSDAEQLFSPASGEIDVDGFVAECINLKNNSDAVPWGYRLAGQAGEQAAGAVLRSHSHIPVAGDPTHAYSIVPLYDSSVHKFPSYLGPKNSTR
jgi:hypothetical protein